MSQSIIEIDVSHLKTEDDTPVDNFASEKNQRLLTETLYSSWAGPGAGRTFLAAANVGVFFMTRKPPVVPDVFLSLDVEVADEWWSKEHRSYFIWEFGKAPDVVIEIVSNTEGQENQDKLNKYAWMRVSHYVIFDPLKQIMPEALTIYGLKDGKYELRPDGLFTDIGLGLTLWEGGFEGKDAVWLRWTDEAGNLIPTGKERAEQEHNRAEQEHNRAEQERQRAEQERQEKEAALQRVERLAELLRQLGKYPDEV